MAARRRKRFALDTFLRRMTNKETAIHLTGGKLVVPGHAKTDRGIIGLVSRALAKGKARVKAKPE